MPSSPAFRQTHMKELKAESWTDIWVLRFDEIVKCRPNRWLCKEAKFKARESRGVRSTSSTRQGQRDEA